MHEKLHKNKINVLIYKTIKKTDKRLRDILGKWFVIFLNSTTSNKFYTTVVKYMKIIRLCIFPRGDLNVLK